MPKKISTQGISRLLSGIKLFFVGSIILITVIVALAGSFVDQNYVPLSKRQMLSPSTWIGLLSQKEQLKNRFVDSCNLGLQRATQLSLSKESFEVVCGNDGCWFVKQGELDTDVAERFPLITHKNGTHDVPVKEVNLLFVDTALNYLVYEVPEYKRIYVAQYSDSTAENPLYLWHEIALQPSQATTLRYIGVRQDRSKEPYLLLASNLTQSLFVYQLRNPWLREVSLPSGFAAHLEQGYEASECVYGTQDGVEAVFAFE